jgi:hypothetical protein
MNSSTSYRTWIGFNDNFDSGITVYSVACYLSQGLQIDVFAFEHDAYLYLVDQAEGLTDEQRIELGQLAELSDRDAFWDLFNASVSPLTSYRIESHTLQAAAQPFQGMNDFGSERAAKAARFRELAKKHANIATGRHFAARERLEMIPLGQPILVGHHSEKRHRKDLIFRSVKITSAAASFSRSVLRSRCSRASRPQPQ